MLQNWLSPIAPSLINKKKNLAFLRNIILYQDQMPDLTKVRMAIIGIEEETANATRKKLYQFSFPFKKLKIADLGNIRKLDPTFLVPVITELIRSNILPVLIGSNKLFAEAQLLAYQKRIVHLALVDEKLVLSKKRKSDYLNKNLNTSKSPTLNLSIIGHQAHLTSPETDKIINDRYFERASLGNVRSNIEEIEPIIRDADFLSMNISAIRYADAPAQQFPSASGLFCEEACQISRYAGLSDKLSSAGFYGFYPEKDDDGQTAQVMAQLIWYFIDGYYNRKNDYPASTEGLIEYIVDLKNPEEQITFWKSKKSGRWWIQIPVKSKSKKQKHKLVPCSYSDYLSTCNEEIPNRLLNAYKKFS